MAYMVVLVSVPRQQINAIQANSNKLLHPTSVVTVSHMVDSVAYAVDAETLGQLLSEAVDGGKTLSKDFNHPLRAPVYHDSAQVKELSQSLDRSWEDVKSHSEKMTKVTSEYRELLNVLKIFRQASMMNECVVIVLLPPTDVEGYDWIKMPFEMEPRKTRKDAATGDRLDKTRRMPRNFFTVLIVGTAGGIFALGTILCFWRYLRHRNRQNASIPDEKNKHN